MPTKHARDGKWCHIAGWGKTDNTRYRDKLQETGINVLSDEYCMKYSHHTSKQINFNSEFCAGRPDRNGNKLTDKDCVQNMNQIQIT